MPRYLAYALTLASALSMVPHEVQVSPLIVCQDGQHGSIHSMIHVEQAFLIPDLPVHGGVPLPAKQTFQHKT